MNEPALPTTAGEFTFWRGQVRPRGRGLLKAASVKISFGLALALTVASALLPVSRVPIQDVASVGITFASISIGACITVLVFILSMPGEERVRRWAQVAGTQTGKLSALSDLVFTVMWAAFAQVGTLVVSLLAFAFGFNVALFEGPNPWHVLALFVSLAVFAYSLTQLVEIVSTLFYVSVVVGAELRKTTSTGAASAEEEQVHSADSAT